MSATNEKTDTTRGKEWKLQWVLKMVVFVEVFERIPSHPESPCWLRFKARFLWYSLVPDASKCRTLGLQLQPQSQLMATWIDALSINQGRQGQLHSCTKPLPHGDKEASGLLLAKYLHYCTQKVKVQFFCESKHVKNYFQTSQLEPVCLCMFNHFHNMTC